MPSLTIHLLLAQTELKHGKIVKADLEEVSRLRNEGPYYDMPWELLLAGIGATLIIIAMISFRRWWRNRHNDPSPMVLFSAISRKAGLGWRDRYLLWRIARIFDLPTPITLMLSKGTLRHYSELYLNNHSTSRHHRSGQRLSRIEAELFG